MKLVNSSNRKRSARPYRTSEQLKHLKGKVKFLLEVEQGLWSEENTYLKQRLKEEKQAKKNARKLVTLIRR